MTKPGPFLRSGMPNQVFSPFRTTRTRSFPFRGDAIVLALRKTTTLSPAPLLCHSRSVATRNMVFPLQTQPRDPSPPGMLPPLRSGCCASAIGHESARDDRAHPTFECCHSEGRAEKACHPERAKRGGISFLTLGFSTPRSLPSGDVIPSFRRQHEVTDAALKPFLRTGNFHNAYRFVSSPE